MSQCCWIRSVGSKDEEELYKFLAHPRVVQKSTSLQISSKYDYIQWSTKTSDIRLCKFAEPDHILKMSYSLDVKASPIASILGLSDRISVKALPLQNYKTMWLIMQIKNRKFLADADVLFDPNCKITLPPSSASVANVLSFISSVSLWTRLVKPIRFWLIIWLITNQAHTRNGSKLTALHNSLISLITQIGFSTETSRKSIKCVLINWASADYSPL